MRCRVLYWRSEAAIWDRPADAGLAKSWKFLDEANLRTCPGLDFGLAKPATMQRPSMDRLKPSSPIGEDARGAALVKLLSGVAVIAGLYFGREVLVPVALAVLLSFILSPPVRLLQGWRVPRTTAVIIVAVIAFAAIFSLSALMVAQVRELAADLPRYQSTLQQKIQSLRSAASGAGTLETAFRVLEDLNAELNKPGRNLTSDAPGEPVHVQIMQPRHGALETLGALMTPLVQPLAATGIVVIFVIFILAHTQDLRNRLIRLAGSNDLQRTTAAFNDAGERLSRLLITQVALNAGFGLVVGAGLWTIGVPSAALWGSLAMILRFVPYIGALIAAVFPLVLAAAVGKDWSMVLWTAALFVIAETLAGQVVEPLLYGHSSGLSPVAVIASATFWTWLWGPVGLVLATPVTICLVVLGRHVEQLRFLEVMFGDEPALTPPQFLYQRLLAQDVIEATEQARTFLKNNRLITYYDEVVVGGLKLAAADVKRGLLNRERTLRIRDSVSEILEDLADYEDRAEATGNPAAQQEDQHTETNALERPAFDPDNVTVRKHVFCVPGFGSLDEAASLIVTQLIERRGIATQAEQAARSGVEEVALGAGDSVICLCYLEDTTQARVRYAVRRFRRRAPTAHIVVLLLGGASITDGEDTTQGFNIDLVKGALGEVVERVSTAATRPSHETANPSRLH